MFTDEQLLKNFEEAGAGLAILIVLICTVAGPRLNHGPTREQLAKAYVSGHRHIVQLQSSLQTAQGNIEAQKTELTKASSSCGQLQQQTHSLQKERGTLKDQITEDEAKIKDLEGQLQTTRAEVAKLNDLITRDDTGKKLDAALTRATKAEDRIRELTLQLHNAGIWP